MQLCIFILLAMEMGLKCVFILANQQVKVPVSFITPVIVKLGTILSL